MNRFNYYIEGMVNYWASLDILFGILTHLNWIDIVEDRDIEEVLKKDYGRKKLSVQALKEVEKFIFNNEFEYPKGTTVKEIIKDLEEDNNVNEMLQ